MSSHILFICSANLERSKTAEDYFTEKYPDIEFRSLGTNQKICLQEGTNYLNEKDLAWADQIYVMETKHKKATLAFSKSKIGKKIKVLNVADHYSYYQKELLEVLEEQVNL